MEVHNVRNFDVVPQECVSHVKKYMTSSKYEDDVERAVDEVILHFGSMCCTKQSVMAWMLGSLISMTRFSLPFRTTRRMASLGKSNSSSITHPVYDNRGLILFDETNNVIMELKTEERS